MPQMVTYSVNVKVEKGPEIKSEAKLEASTYSASVEELVCRGGTAHIDVVADLCKDILVVSSNIYANDKDPCPAPMDAMEKCLKFQLCDEQNTLIELKGCCTASANQQSDAKPAPSGCSVSAAPAWCPLTKPFVVSAPAITPSDKKVSKISFKNDLASDVKVSVLVLRPRTSCKC
jgi:hypothetical protein